MNNEQKIKLAFNSAVISGIFCAIVSLLLLLNFIQYQQHDPLELNTINTLVERLKDEPNNDDLKKEIRQLDLLARKAYFTSQWQVTTGGYLLLFGAIVLIFSLRVYKSETDKIELPQNVEVYDRLNRLLSQRWFIISGSALFAVGLVAALLSHRNFDVYQISNEQIAQQESPVDDEGIEVIEVSDDNQSTTASDTSSEQIPQTATEGDERMAAEEEAQTDAEEKDQESTTAAKKSVKPSFPTLAEIKRNHPSFRGPLGNGTSYAENVPTQWDGASGKNIIWKIEDPRHGYNSPIIWEDKLFIAGGDESIREIFCIDKNTGAIIWKHLVDNIPGSPSTPPETTDDTGLAAPTLTTDGIHVYGIFGTGDVIALTMDGKRVWAKNIGVPDNHYGHSSSLLTWKEKLLIQFDSNKGGRVLSLNVNDGSKIWDKKRESRISWASPVLADIDGQMQIILSAVPIVAGYDITNGEQKWSVEIMMGEVGPSPVYANGLVIAGNEYATLAAIDPSGGGKVVWESMDYLPEVASPVVGNDMLLIATTYGVVACYDIHTGNKYWEQDFGTEFYSSPMYVEGSFYAADMEGTMHIMKASAEAEIVSQPNLGESIVTTPAFDNGRIYIRGEKHLFCIGTK